MNDDRPAKISVTQGNNPRTKAGSISGADSEYDADGRPLIVLSLAPKSGTSVRVDLHEGDTFELGPELWLVTEISLPNTDLWSAELAQVR